MKKRRDRSDDPGRKKQLYMDDGLDNSKPCLQMPVFVTVCVPAAGRESNALHITAFNLTVHRLDDLAQEDAWVA